MEKIRQEKNWNMSKWIDIHKDFWTISSVKMTRYPESIQVSKCFNILKLYTLKALLILFFFFSSSAIQKFHHLLGCDPLGINSSLVFSLIALHFSISIYQTKSMIRIIVSGSSSKLISRLITLRSVSKIYPFHYKKIRHCQKVHWSRIYFHQLTKQ